MIVANSQRQAQIEVQRADQQALFRCRTQRVRRSIAELEVLPALDGMREMPWLLLFAGYLVVMMDEDARAGATTAAGPPSALHAERRPRWWSRVVPTHTS